MARGLPQFERLGPSEGAGACEVGRLLEQGDADEHEFQGADAPASARLRGRPRTARRLGVGLLALAAAVGLASWWTRRSATSQSSLRRARLQGDMVEVEVEYCRTIAKGSEDDELCYLRVDWVMREGIRKHPDWYPGLSEGADFAQVQQHVSEEDGSPCPRPCVAEDSTATAETRKDKHKASPEVQQESCSNGWAIAPGCLKEFKYNGNTYRGCTTEDSVEFYGNQAWCSNEPVYDSLWSLCQPCDWADPASSSTPTIDGATTAPTTVAIAEVPEKARESTTTAAAAKEEDDDSSSSTTTDAGTASTSTPMAFTEVPEKAQASTTTTAKAQKVDEGCRTVQESVEKDAECYNRVAWVRTLGMTKYPEFYKGLDEKSSFEEVQDFIHKEEAAVCPVTCRPKARRPKKEANKAKDDSRGKGSKKPNSTSPKASSSSCPVCAPAQPVAPDVVIPFFERDLCKLKYTAKSLSSNDPHKRLGDVFLMWVSDKPSARYQGDIDAIVASIETSRNVHFRDFSGALEASGISGWFGQQVLKLKIASSVTSDFYVVLDTKNTLIREIEKDTFFSRCNQAKIQAEFRFDDIPKPHSDWYRRSAAALQVDEPSAGYWPASITPMVMHKSTVLDMLNAIGEAPEPDHICAGPLCDQMGARSESGNGATEFTMYTLWAYQRTNLDCAHTVEVVPHFEVKYSSTWRDEADSQLKKIHFDSPDEQQQITVTSKGGYPFDWSSPDGDDPTKEEFPLKFEDLTTRWATSLWRGVPENAQLVQAVNLWTIQCLTEGKQLFPLMFGAQPEALGNLSHQKRQKAVTDLAAIYSRAKLHDPATESDDDLVACVVGWQN